MSTTHYIYSISDLKTLVACIKANPHSLMEGLKVFLHETGRGDISWNEAIELWGRYAEKAFNGTDIIAEVQRMTSSPLLSFVSTVEPSQANIPVQQLTIEETRRIIDDFTSLVGGPEQGVRSNSGLLKMCRELQAFLSSKGYPTSEYDLETRYKYSAERES